MRRSKRFFLIFFAVSIFLSGFVGYLLGNKNLALTQQGPKLIKTDVGQPSDIDFSLFWDAYSRLKDNYLGNIDAKKLLYGAISGAFASLDDPYTVFLSPEVSKEFSDELSGQLEGIGIKIGSLDGYPAVIAPINNSPAQKAGLKAKDKIAKIDDKDATQISLDEAVSLIRGKAGTTVKLEIIREGESVPRVFEIKREQINVKTVETKMFQDVAVIELTEFGVDTTSDFVKEAQSLKDKGIKKIVLDLRNNPGGLLNSAIDVAGEILESGKTVVIEESKGGKKPSVASGEGILKDTKIVVLVNGGSASASEILAGAVKENNRGILIGEKTFGKGTVQELQSMEDGSSVKITVAKWLTPNGNSIDKNGITPDIEMTEPDNVLFSENDPLITRAIEELNK